jgi:2-polyprenyl-3-methyl-5-hydroxy-6-metoxy-1,4-benzoquinol methylase
MRTAAQSWPVLLFNKSVLKQKKFKEITEALGITDGLCCLDIGSDNGVISYFLRRKGGVWKSADLDENAIRSIRELVECNVYSIDGRRTPFRDNEFDRVVIVDFLEHIETDREFIEEMFRVIKPGGAMIINVPYIKNSLLRKLRIAIGQTDEKHGHVRPGYTVTELAQLLSGRFTIVSTRTYSKFFSECIDTLISFVFALLKGRGSISQKGLLVTGSDLQQYQRMFRAYSLIYPLLWFFGKLDLLLFWCSGYMLIVKTKVSKNPVHT